MSKTILQFIFKCVVLILAQVVIFNNIVLFNAVVPFVFIYIIISAPVTWSVNVVLTIGFFSGMAVDAFSNTQGVNALACTVLASAVSCLLPVYAARRRPVGP